MVTSVVDHLFYDAYGNQTTPQTATDPQEQSPIGFAGMRWDALAGLYDTDTRPYDPATGTWIQPDPDGYDAGDSNLYRYVGNDPTTEEDPSGLAGQSANASCTCQQAASQPFAVGSEDSGGAAVARGQAEMKAIAAHLEAQQAKLRQMNQMGFFGDSTLDVSQVVRLRQNNPGLVNDELAGPGHNGRFTINVPGLDGEAGKAYTYEWVDPDFGFGTPYYKLVSETAPTQEPVYGTIGDGVDQSHVIPLQPGEAVPPGFTPGGPSDVPSSLQGAWRVSIIAGGGHSWIRYESMTSNEVHTAGRYKEGYGGRTDEDGRVVVPPIAVPGIQWDQDLIKEQGLKDGLYQTRSMIVVDPAIYNDGLFGYGNLKNNCTTYAVGAWAFYTDGSEHLSGGWLGLVDDPSMLMESIRDANAIGPYEPPGPEPWWLTILNAAGRSTALNPYPPGLF
jgi:RHS repeat-associated protein